MVFDQTSYQTDQFSLNDQFYLKWSQVGVHRENIDKLERGENICRRKQTLKYSELEFHISKLIFNPAMLHGGNVVES